MSTHRHARRREPVQDLVRAHVLEHLDVLRTQAPAAGEADASAIHAMRTSARRLRSVLAAYSCAFAPGATDEAKGELRWIGGQLADARDAHVLRDHLAQVLSEQPAELVIDAVASRVDLELGLAERDGQQTARTAVKSDRFQRLLTSLEELARSSAWSEESGQAAGFVARRVLAHEAKSLRRAIRHAEVNQGADLHRVRKQAKRLRYAADCARPALGGRAAELATRAKAVQGALGDHQDSVVARERLRQIGIAAHLDRMNAFTFGRLHGLEELRAEQSLSVYADAAGRLPRRHVKRWLRH